MAQDITWLGNRYQNVPAIELPKTAGGNAKFTDVTPTTISDDADVTAGKIYFKADGTQSTGTNSGGGGWSIGSKSSTPSSNDTSISFSGLSGEPKFFYIEQTGQNSLSSSSSSRRYVVSVFFDGTSMSGDYFMLTGNKAANTNHNTDAFSKSYSGGTLTVSSGSSSTGGYFKSGVSYKLVYCY